MCIAKNPTLRKTIYWSLWNKKKIQAKFLEGSLSLLKELTVEGVSLSVARREMVPITYGEARRNDGLKWYKEDIIGKDRVSEFLVGVQESGDIFHITGPCDDSFCSLKIDSIGSIDLCIVNYLNYAIAATIPKTHTEDDTKNYLLELGLFYK